MKKGLRYLLAIATVLFFACGKDNGNGSGNDDDKSSSSNYELKREEIIGEWDIEKAKFDKAATMTDWDLGPTTFEFKENGFFEAKGYFGNGTGSFSIQGATITTVLENKPFIDFEIFGIKDKKVDVVATIRSSKQQVWMTWYQPLVVIGGGEVSVEQLFNDEKNVQMVIFGAYSKLVTFAVKKQTIETDVIAGNFEKLRPNGSEIILGWSAAYASLYYINNALDILCGSNDYKSRYAGHIAHLKVLRAYIAYNFATLWGRARYEETKHEVPNLPPIFNSEELLQFADKNLNEALSEDYSLNGVDKQKYFNHDAAQILAGEVSLALGNKSQAKTLLEYYGNYTPQSADLYFEFIESDVNGQIIQTIPVYTKMHGERLYKEADGQLTGLVDSWKQVNLQSGFWQMLKRNGWAESVTGCQKYQLLFPFPENEVSADFPQNEGY